MTNNLTELPKLLFKKKGIIFGLANEKSIAYSVAKHCHENGAELAFTYLNDAFKIPKMLKDLYTLK